MTRIHSRPTQHIQLLGVEYVYASHDLRPIRATRHCPICGARLARDRAFYDTLCSPCELRHTANIDPVELHPETSYERQKHRASGTRRQASGSVGAAGLGTEPAAPHGAQPC